MVDLTRTFSFREQVFPHILRERARNSDSNVGLDAGIVINRKDGILPSNFEVKQKENGSHMTVR